METEKLPDLPEAPEPVETPETEGDAGAEEDPSAEPADEG